MPRRRSRSRSRSPKPRAKLQQYLPYGLGAAGGLAAAAAGILLEGKRGGVAPAFAPAVVAMEEDGKRQDALALADLARQREAFEAYVKQVWLNFARVVDIKQAENKVQGQTAEAIIRTLQGHVETLTKRGRELQTALTETNRVLGGNKTRTAPEIIQDVQKLAQEAKEMKGQVEVLGRERKELGDYLGAYQQWVKEKAGEVRQMMVNADRQFGIKVAEAKAWQDSATGVIQQYEATRVAQAQALHQQIEEGKELAAAKARAEEQVQRYQNFIQAEAKNVRALINRLGSERDKEAARANNWEQNATGVVEAYERIRKEQEEKLRVAEQKVNEKDKQLQTLQANLTKEIQRRDTNLQQLKTKAQQEIEQVKQSKDRVLAEKELEIKEAEAKLQELKFETARVLQEHQRRVQFLTQEGQRVEKERDFAKHEQRMIAYERNVAVARFQQLLAKTQADAKQNFEASERQNKAWVAKFKQHVQQFRELAQKQTIEAFELGKSYATDKAVGQAFEMKDMILEQMIEPMQQDLAAAQQNVEQLRYQNQALIQLLDDIPQNAAAVMGPQLPQPMDVDYSNMPPLDLPPGERQAKPEQKEGTVQTRRRRQ